MISSYVLGICIGDGYLATVTPAISVADRDIEILEKVKTLLPINTVIGNQRTGENCCQYTISTPSDAINRNQKNRNTFKVEIDRLKLNVKSHFKFIPNEYLIDTIENRIELLRGLMDADGSCSNNRTKFSTMSLRLANDVVRLVQSLGGIAILYKQTKKGEYSVNVKTKFNPFYVSFKSSRWSYSAKNPPARYIKSVEPVGECEQVCIKVDAEDSLYLTDQFIVTHNTSSLVMMANEIAEPSIYLAFNKVSATEALVKFPDHVECRTTHSVAYAKFGRNMQDKLTRPKGSYVNVAGTGSEIARYYKIMPLFAEGSIKVSQSHVGNLVKYTIASFEQSSDENISDKHLPYGELKDIFNKHKIDTNKLGKEIVKHAVRMWKDRIDMNSNVLATHDTYLKLWQLSKPVLDFSVIYLDEAQDTTECVLDVVMRQTHAKIVLVGDKRQNIYGWRGSINAMEFVPDAVQCELTKSFRYGQKIADIANSVLNHSTLIIGMDNINSIAGTKVVDRSQPYVILCRTNAYLLDTAIIDIEARRNVSIEVDVRDFIRVLQSAQALFDDNMKEVKHERVVPYNTWEELVEEGKNGGEFNRISAIVSENRSARMISILSTYVNPSNPDIIYTTAHKSKGREWKQIVLGNDYPSNYSKGGEWIGLSITEQNLLYVACTRAILNLEYNKTITEILDKEKEDYASVLGFSIDENVG